jgi:hypothetical protein
MPNHNIPLKTFFEEVERRLNAYSAEELRSILRQLADRVPPAGRRSFLEDLQPAATSGDFLQQVLRQDELLAEIDDLVREIWARQQHADAWDDYDSYHDDEDSSSMARISSGPTYLPTSANWFTCSGV